MGIHYRYDLESKSLYEVGSEPPSSVHSVIGDEMAPTINHIDGKTYTSKSEFRKTVRAAGCIEFGNEDLLKKRKPEVDQRVVEQRKQGIARIYNDLSIAGGRNDKLPPTPEYSEYMRRKANGY